MADIINFFEHQLLWNGNNNIFYRIVERSNEKMSINDYYFNLCMLLNPAKLTWGIF